MTALLPLLIIALVILVHETGHYLAMRRLGVKVTSFSLGFGPRLAGFTDSRGTEFMLKLLPLGGSVRTPQTGPDAFENQPRMVRFKVAMAGMLANAVTAFVVLLIVHYSRWSVPAMLVPFLQWAPLWAWPLLAAFIGSFGIWLGTPILLVVMIHSMGGHEVANSIAGPVGIVVMGQQIATVSPGFWDYVANYGVYFANISAALAGMNMLPILPLDGGYIPALLIEKWFGAAGKRFNFWFRIVGVLLLLALIVWAFYADISRLALVHRLLVGGILLAFVAVGVRQYLAWRASLRKAADEGCETDQETADDSEKRD